MKTGLDDPRAVQILTTEHWSLLSARTLGYQEMFFVTGHEPGADPGALAHGAAQRPRNLASSLTTTSSVVAALDSALAGALASALTSLAGLGLVIVASVGAVVSLVSAVLHVRYAARYRQAHAPTRRPRRDVAPGRP